MNETVKDRTLEADNGYIYTDGADTFGYTIHVAEGVDKNKYYQITDEEYQRIKAEKENLQKMFWQ